MPTREFTDVDNAVDYLRTRGTRVTFATLDRAGRPYWTVTPKGGRPRVLASSQVIKFANDVKRGREALAKRGVPRRKLRMRRA